MRVLDSIQVMQKRLKRWPMHRAIRSLVQWEPLANPAGGYTIVVGCMNSLPEVAIANLRLMQDLAAARLKEIILVFDCIEGDLAAAHRKAIDTIGKKLPIRLLFYSPQQVKVARAINWGWVYSWMSWCIGTARATTRHVLLHDLDALVLDPQLFEQIYDRILASSSAFHGVRWYESNGITKDMRLVVTFEMIFDAAFVRANFQPFDVFNHLSIHEGRYVDYDTFLYVQSKTGSREVTSIDESQLVHPSQLICDFTDMMAGRTARLLRQHSLLMLPYFFFLGGDEQALRDVSSALRDGERTELPFRDRLIPIGQLQAAHWAWSEKQIRRVEQRLYDHTREPVQAYLDGFVKRAGHERTVGREPLESGGVALR